MDCTIGYVIVGVKSFDTAIPFYRDVMGFELLYCEPEFHFASFKVGDLSFSLADLPAAIDHAFTAHGWSS